MPVEVQFTSAGVSIIRAAPQHRTSNLVAEHSATALTCVAPPPRASTLPGLLVRLAGRVSLYRRRGVAPSCYCVPKCCLQRPSFKRGARLQARSRLEPAARHLRRQQLRPSNAGFATGSFRGPMSAPGGSRHTTGPQCTGSEDGVPVNRARCWATATIRASGQLRPCVLSWPAERERYALDAGQTRRTARPTTDPRRPRVPSRRCDPGSS